jgi:cytoplasmic iron level regulating protein YaaA (DUF328/UPF0246 family)
MRSKPLDEMSLPYFSMEAQGIMDNLKSRSKQKLKETLNVSDKLFMETIEMMEEWTVERTSRSGAAVFSYSGDVYAGLESALWNKEDMDYANNHLFILSAVYGILRCKDYISPYRLEMASKFDIDGKKSLYAFWKERVSQWLADLSDQNHERSLVNLASLEYSKVVDRRIVHSPWIDVFFKELSKGKLKVVAYHSKIARGKMAAWIIKNRIESADDLINFNEDGYVIDINSSSKDELVFIR